MVGHATVTVEDMGGIWNGFINLELIMIQKIYYLDTLASKCHIFGGKSNGAARRSLWDWSWGQKSDKEHRMYIFTTFLVRSGLEVMRRA